MENKQESRVDILMEEFDKILIERGLPPAKYVNKTGSFVIIPVTKNKNNDKNK